jgi:hypothetical protein
VEDARPKPLDCTGKDGVSAADVQRAQEAWAKYLGRQVEETVEVANGVKMTFVLVPPGKFLMGSPVDEEGRNPLERLATAFRGEDSRLLVWLATAFRGEDSRLLVWACPFCKQEYHLSDQRGTRLDPFTPLVKAIIDLASLSDRLEIEFIVPQKD